jgi:hypothetical protein
VIAIESNLAGVIRRTEALIRNIPVAMEQALAPALWIDEARELALRTLLAVAAPQDRQHIAGFVATVTAAALEKGGLALAMKTPFPELRNILAQTQVARRVIGPADLSQSLFQGQLADFDQLILEWVETPENAGGKRRDSRDWGKSDEEIAALISYIMLSPNPGPRALAARARLTPHIAAFLEQAQQGNRLDAVTVDVWLRAVLAAWREMFRMRYLAKVRAIVSALGEQLI